MSDKNFKVKNGLDANGAVTITQPDTSTVPLTILANTLATGPDLFQVKRPDGTVRLSVGNDGALSSQNLTAYNVTFYSSQAGSIPLVLRGQSSQSADLQQWRNVSDTVLAKVDANGSITAVDLTLSGNLTVNGTTTNLNSTNLVIEDKNIIIADVASPTDTTADGAGITIKGATDKTFNWVAATTAFTSSEPLIVNNTSTTTVPLLVKGYASQTANLQQWQDSAGTALAKIEATGAAQFGGTSGTRIDQYGNVNIRTGGSQYDGANLSINTVVNGARGIVVRGVNTQYANLQEWQNSSGSVLAKVESNGTITIGAGRVQLNGNNSVSYFADGISSDGSYYGGGTVRATSGGIFGGTTQLSSAGLTVYPTAAGNPGAVIRGAASQTANLQEWQNSSGAVNAAIVPSKGILLNLGNDYSGSENLVQAAFGYNALSSSSGYWKHYITTNHSAGTLANNSINFYTNDGVQAGVYPTNAVFGLSITNGGVVSPKANINISSASNIGLIVKGAASQTADLQQWQNGAGATLANISSAGKLVIKNDSEPATSLISTSQAVGGTVSVTTLSTSNDYALTLNATGGGYLSNVGMAFSVFAGTGFNGVYPPGAAIWFSRTGGYSLGYLSFLTRSGTSSLDPLSERMRIGESGTITVNGFTASSVGLIIKGTSSQTADLQQWQDSSGTVVSSITYFGGVRPYDLGIKGSPAGIALAYFGNDNTSTKNVVVRAFASQSASLQEWQNSAGTVNAKIDAYGTFSNGTASNYGSWINVQPALTTDKGIVIRGAASQTANLQEWQNSAGTVLTYVASDGTFVTRGALIGGSFSGNNIFGVQGYSTSITTAVVKGVASQTANLQEWQDSAGNVMAQISSAGDIYANARSVLARFIQGNTGAGAYIDLGFSSGNSVSIVGRTSTTAPQLIIKSIASQTANLQEWQNSAGTVLANISNSGAFTAGSITSGLVVSTGDIKINSGNALFESSNTGTYLIFGSTGITVTHRGSTSNTNFIVKGMASQTSNLQEWQNSSGTILARISSSGDIISTSSVFSTIYLGGAGYFTSNLNITPSATTNIGAVIRGAVSQTANLQEWQNSSGTVLASISSSGGLGINAIGNPASVGPYQSFNSSDITITSRAAANVGLIIKAAASQSANLQEWQDSSGAVVAKVLSTGAFNTTNQIKSTLANAGQYAFYAEVGNATTIPIVAKGAFSQTANLQEWQSVNGTVLSAVSAYGGLGLNSAPSLNTYLIVSTGSASIIGQIIKGASGQTADLQQWQNNAGSVLAKVDANGNFSAVSKSFDISHPTKENMRLRYASLEGPENGVYIRGTTESNIIELPEYWTELVHEDSITVSLTAVGSAQNIYVEKIEDNKVYIGGELTKAFFTVYGERKDIDKLTVEY